MMNTCDNCVYCGRPPYKSPCSECIGFDKWESEAKIITNADHIRSMSDEELAYYLKFIVSQAQIYGMAYVTKRKEWIDWLKQPYKEKE